MNNYLLGLELLVIGMGTVFLSLYLLSVFLCFSGKLFGPESSAQGSRKNKASKKIKLQPAEAEKKNLLAGAEKEGISAQKIAAITAAAAEFLKGEKEYRIISIQKSNQNWKR